MSRFDRFAYRFYLAMFMLQGPIGTFVFTALLLGHPQHASAYTRGVLTVPAFIWVVVGWLMTAVAVTALIKGDFPEAQPDGK